jgi:hypothetical protein
VGEFPFHRDVFCGSGHDQMEGTIKVTDRYARVAGLTSD